MLVVASVSGTYFTEYVLLLICRCSPEPKELAVTGIIAKVVL
jgi:hypothetical protein